jgi:deoxyribodipyrimidine photolyase-related protein
MKGFANALSVRGHEVLHLELDDTATFDSLDDLIKNLCQRFDVTEFSYQQPDEYRLSEQLRQLSAASQDSKMLRGHRALSPAI